MFQASLGRNKATYRPGILGKRHLRDGLHLEESQKNSSHSSASLSLSLSPDRVDWTPWHLRDFIEFGDSFEVVPRAPSTWYVPR